MKKTCVAFLLLLFASRLASQTAANVTLLTVNDGLSQGLIFDFLQSRDGFLWIATKDGLNRYDGARFEVFSPDPFDAFAIGESEVFHLFEDSRGWIWLEYPDGLDILDPVSLRFFHVTVDGKPIRFPGWRDLAETPDGAVWLSLPDRICKFSLQKDMLQKALEKGNAYLEMPCKTIPMPSTWSGEPFRVNAPLIFTQTQKLLIGSNHGVWSLDPGSEKIALLGLPTVDVSIMLQDREGRIWAQIWADKPVGHATIVWDEQAGIRQSQSISGDRIICKSDQAGFLWIKQDKILKKFQPEKFLNNGAADIQWPFDRFLESEGFNISQVFIDRSGMLWAGTNGFGVFKINLQNPTFKSYLPKTTQRRIYEDTRGNLIALADIHVQYSSSRFDRSEPNRSFTAYRYPDAYGRYLAFDANGNCWTSDPTDEPILYCIDTRSKERKAFPWRALGLCFDKNGALLGAGEDGLHQLDPASGQIRIFPFRAPLRQRSEFSHFFWRDAEDVIWIFGFDGLVKAVPMDSDYHFEYYLNNPADRSSLSSNTVLSVADDPLEPKRYLWVGTKGGGLNRLDKKSGRFKQFKTEQGLPDNVVYGVLAENAKPFIWLSTNKGLCRFDVRAEMAKNFTAADGLQDNEFNSSSYLKMRDGTMIFGGVRGLTVFHPDSLRFNEHIPQTRIVGLQVNNKPFDILGRSSVTLSYDQNLLTFNFAALEFTNPAQNQYRYQLVPVDKDWVSLGNKNSIQFANLAPGTYTFKVDGSNNDGVWSGRPAELRFTIRPPWYASWWAYLIYLALAAGAIWWYYQYLLRQRFSDQEKQRLQELDEFKSRFFTNITHEFRTPLTVMLGMSDQLAKDEKDEPKRNKLGLIKRSGENLLRLVNQILDLAKLESKALQLNYIQGDVLAFIRYVAESLHSLANAQNLMLRVESDRARIVMDYDPERLLQIVHNLLSNAVKFTPSGGKVVLRADVKDQWLHISVADSGAGIPPEELPHLFERFFQAKNQEHAKAGGTGIGLSLTRELVRAMGGEISVESTVGAGSTFFVKLPITNNSVFEERPVEISKIPTASRRPAAKSPAADPDRWNILVIEDNPDVVEYLDACLKDAYNLDFAYNGQAGIEKALESVPDLIVSDVMMPFKDGFEVVEDLKNDERTSHIPIILLTAKADVQSRLAGLRKGADAYLSKPFHQEELLVTVENLLETRRKLQLKYQQNMLAPTPTEATPASDTEDVFLQKVRAIVEANYQQEDFGLPQLCQKIGMSRSQLFRKMKALTDIAPSDLIRTHRLNKAKALLESGAANVAEAAWQVGFKDPSYFSKLYQEEFGETPSATRK
ncbi:MAG: ATP-binding protein [Saprospiraceae bacterium]